jgi:outer membrane lipoprotein-sorting protein
LHLMIKKIKQPAGIVVHQTRNVMGVSARETQPEAESETKPLTKPLTKPESKPEIGPVALDEKLVYLYPGKFRSEIISGTVSRFYVESGSQFVKVADGGIVSREKSPVDFYTDILLYRDHESLSRQLALAGVNTERVTFQRFDNKICYFIGQPPLNQKEMVGLWIDKESLFPIRYVIKKNGWTVSFHYENWQRVSKTWYPMQTTIFVDDQLFTKIVVGQFQLASGFPPALFDVNSIQGRYPVRGGALEEDPGSPEGIDELDRQIEIFRKLYE